MCVKPFRAELCRLEAAVFPLGCAMPVIERKAGTAIRGTAPEACIFTIKQASGGLNRKVSRLLEEEENRKSESI